MKKMIQFLLVFLLLLLSGCNKEEKVPEPTATPTPTATPVPENLAIISLQDFSAALNTFQDYFPKDAADFSKGAGYDVSLDITLEDVLTESLGISGLNQFHIDGTMDIKDTLAAQGTIYLQNEKLIIGQLIPELHLVMTNWIFN